jgi:WD40 repeat protein/energy-coupling factor transporter ATP-binding protein EcfA2
VGCAAETLRKIEADVRRPSRQMAQRLAEALEVPETDQPAFIRAARAELAVDRLTLPTQDIPQAAILPSNTLSTEAVTFLFTQITSTFQIKPFDGRCPYKGLDVFEEEDAELFFGRERLIEDLLERLKESRTIFLIGPSGSGKSSLMRAGLIHALKAGAIQSLRSERWLYETMKPGRDPIGEVARVISSMAGTINAGDEVRARALANDGILTRWCEIALKEGRDKRAVLFIDQFEEVFTQVSSEVERLAFLNLLTHTATAEHGRASVLFAMRSDFVLNCANYPQLNALFNQHSIQIGAMQPDELVSAIAQPALGVGLHIDPDLVAQIINDMQGEPGALPLMQFALKDLFDSQQAKGGKIDLTLSDYLQQGGMHKSLERHADGSFAKLDGSEQELARSIFSRLIEIGHGTQDTRRTALFDELIPADSKADEVQVVIQKLADARLITTDEQAGKDTVTISHEKLIDAWPWLRKLVDDNREAIALQNEIVNDAKEWEDHQRDPSYLYTGVRLANAREQAEAKKLVLSGTVNEFVQTSIKVFNDEIEATSREEARKKHLQKRIIVGLIGLTTIILVLLVFALIQLNVSRALQLSAQAQAAFAEENYNAAALYAHQSNQIHKNDISNRILARLPYENFELGQGLIGHISPIIGVAWSADGRLASVSIDGIIIIWDLSTGQPAQTFQGHTDWVTSITWSTDGRLASGSVDKTIVIWNSSTGQPDQILKGHVDGIASVAWSADGRLASGSVDGTIIIWDLSTGQPAQTLQRHSSSINSVAWSTDGRLASASDDNTVIIWDPSIGRPNQILRGHTDWVSSVAWSMDGGLASVSLDGFAIIWDLTSGQPDQILQGKVSDIAWSPDGRLASSSIDKTVIIWDLLTGQAAQTLKGHVEEGIFVAWSTDGRLASGSVDGTIILWDLSTAKPAQTLEGHTDRVTSIAWSADSHLASGSDDGTIILWDLSTAKPAQILKRHKTGITSLAWSEDDRLASSSGDKTVILWDLATGPPAQILQGHTLGVNSVAWSADGDLASASNDTTVIVWDLTTGQPAQTLQGHADRVRSVAWSPDGRLASGSDDGTIILWDLSAAKPAQTLSGHIRGGVTSVAWSADGRLASGSVDGTIILWDLSTAKPAQTLQENISSVNNVAWSVDGRLASAMEDGSIIIWDLSTDQPAHILQGIPESINFFIFTFDNTKVAWSADGRLASGSVDQTVKITRADIIRSNPCDWIYRNMTADEWLAFQGIVYIYQPACPNLSNPMFLPTNYMLREVQTIDSGYIAFRYYTYLRMTLITWKGRITIVILLSILAGVLWALYRLLLKLLPRSVAWVRQIIHKRRRKDAEIA